MLNLAKLKSFTRDADDKSETSANGHLAPANQSMSGKIPTDALLRAQMPDNEDEEEEDDEEELTFWKALKKNFRDVKKEVFREVVNYGPPYIDNERLFPENLMYECSVLKPNLLKIHNLLNMRANPNTPDEEDLNFTPLQWACRRNQLRVAQMLIEAHANVNAVNEMGHTSLIFACMFRPKDAGKRKQRLELVKLLIASGAGFTLDRRDKGGFAAVDFAAMTQDKELVSYLLSIGARVSLENQYLVTKRKPILHYVTDHDLYGLISRKLREEEEVVRQEELRKAAVKAEQAALVLAEVARLEYEQLKHKNHELRLQRKQDAETARLEARQRAIRAQLDEQMAVLVRPVNAEARAYHVAEWRKEDRSMWVLRVKKDTESTATSSVYAEARSVVKELRDESDMGVLASRWGAACPGIGPFRAVIRRNKLFDIPGLEGEAGAKKEVCLEARDKVQVVLDFELRRSGDVSLDGEDLAGLLDVLPSVRRADTHD